MFCFLALIVFSILGIFSASNRELALEALDCVFRRVTFRPCNTGFKDKIKSKILSKLLDRSVVAARIFNRHFELLSWIFFILSAASLVYTVRGGINYYLYGNCNGPVESGFCVFDPAGENSKVSTPDEATCSLTPKTESSLDLSFINTSEFPHKKSASENNIVFIGCYSCDYSRKAYPDMKKLINKYDPNFTFIHFPVKSSTYFLSKYDYCAFKEDQEKFWDFSDAVFNAPIANITDQSFLTKALTDAGYNAAKINACLSATSTEIAVEKQYQQIQKAGIYGTPTVFINGQPVVGPKPYRVYSRMMK